MRTALLAVIMVFSVSGAASADSNPVAVGVEKMTKAPFTLLKGANEHVISPVREVDAAALDFTDNARAAAVSVGLNLGKAVE